MMQNKLDKAGGVQCRGCTVHTQTEHLKASKNFSPHFQSSRRLPCVRRVRTSPVSGLTLLRATSGRTARENCAESEFQVQRETGKTLRRIRHHPNAAGGFRFSIRLPVAPGAGRARGRPTRRTKRQRSTERLASDFHFSVR